MSNQTVVTRFAPSPTGYLHIGGARTALFNWAFARGRGGRFILRLEDTDRARSTAAAAQRILEDLRWLGMDWDAGPDPDAADPLTGEIGGNGGGVGGPYSQSRRLDIYNEYIERLLESGRAYKCFKTSEDLAADRRRAREQGRAYKYDGAESRALTGEQIAALEAEGRPSVVRFHVPDEEILVRDDVLGELTVPAGDVEDFVIRKSDGYPTYHLAVTVDDALMGVTHVIRGQEHLNNTPKHRALQAAMGFEPPVYAHIPLIFNADGSKMSKRDKVKAARAAVSEWLAGEGHDVEQLGETAGLDPYVLRAFLEKESDDASVAELLAGAIGVSLPEIDVADFRSSGYLPEVLCNYLALLGWSPGENREKFDMDFLVDRFDFGRVGKANARFDRAKLFRFNADALTELPVEEFTRRWRSYCERFQPVFVEKLDERAFEKLAAAYHERSRTFLEPCENARFFVIGDGEIEYDAKAVKKVLRKNEGQGFGVLRELGGELAEAVGGWEAGRLEAAIKGYAERRELGLGKVAQPLRVAVSGSTVSPPIFDTLEILGRDAVLARVERCLALEEEDDR